VRLALSLLCLRPGRVGGAETYVRKLVQELPRAASDGDTLVAVLDRDLSATFEAPGWERAVVERGARHIVAERMLEAFTPYRALGVERVFRNVAADVVLFPQQSIFPKRVPGSAVVTIGDVQHLCHPENISLFDRAFRQAIYTYSMKHARQLIAISAFTRGTLVEKCGIAPERISVVPHGFEPCGSPPAATHRVKGPYLCYPAATYPHKNHAVLIRTYATLRRRGALDAKLVFTGMKTPEWKGLARLVRDLGVEGDVVHLGFLPYPEVRRVFAGAQAVVFPSRYEGFGIPVVEAAVEFGKNVITSRLPVFDEIGVPANRQIDFGDADALLEALRQPGPTVLARLPTTWADCARATLEIARRAAPPRSAAPPRRARPSRSG
jgi:glycosyltransferase involved in cell wall biosynthesis